MRSEPLLRFAAVAAALAIAVPAQGRSGRLVELPACGEFASRLVHIPADPDREEDRRAGTACHAAALPGRRGR